MPGDQAYGESFERPGLAKPPRMDFYRGFVFASFDPDIVSLEDYLAGAKEYLDLIADQSEVGMEVIEGAHENSCKANWKLLVENNVDGYHAMSTHQRYFEMVLAARGDKVDMSLVGRERSIDLGNGHAVVAAPPAPRSCSAARSPKRAEPNGPRGTPRSQPSTVTPGPSGCAAAATS